MFALSYICLNRCTVVSSWNYRVSNFSVSFMCVKFVTEQNRYKCFKITMYYYKSPPAGQESINMEALNY